eukprot:7513614-Pyramimonas_sp.AAC.1
MRLPRPVQRFVAPQGASPKVPADDPRASLGPSRGDQRASQELRAAFYPAPRPPVVAQPSGKSLARNQPASSLCSAQRTTRARR